MTCGDGSAANTAAGEWIKMAKKLCETLQKGHVRYGNIRVPLNGDTTRLALAEGLSPQERSLAEHGVQGRVFPRHSSYPSGHGDTAIGAAVSSTGIVCFSPYLQMRSIRPWC